MIAASTVLAPIIKETAMKSLQVALEEHQHQRLKHVAADTGKTLAALVREAVALLISQHASSKEGR